MENNAVSFWPYYNRDLPVNVMVIGETICSDDYYVCRNQSRIMAIEYIVSGSGTLNINSKSYNPPPNCAILLTKHSHHDYFSDKDNPWVKRWIVFDGILMQQFIDLYLPKDTYCFENCNLLPYFNEIEKVVRTESKNYSRMVDQLSIILHKMIIRIRNSVKENGYTIYELIKTAIDERIEGRLSLDEICKEFNYSKNQIISIFKKAYGMTPYKYFEAKKTDVAKLYLCNTNLTIDEIACKLSYTDRNYFANCFKTHTGITPAKYRIQNK